MSVSFSGVRAPILVGCVGAPLAIPGAARALEPVVLVEGQEKYPLGLHLEYLEDPTGKLTIDDVRSASYADKFVPSNSPVLNFGLTRSAIWVRFRVLNKSAKGHDWILDTLFGDGPDYLDFYAEVGPGEFRAIHTGSMRPYANRQIPHKNFLFRLEPVQNPPSVPSPSRGAGKRESVAPPPSSSPSRGEEKNLPSPSTVERGAAMGEGEGGGEHLQTYYLRYASENGMLVMPTLWTPGGFARKDQVDLLLHGIYLGIVLIMTVYNLLLFAAIRDRTYLYYGLHVIGFGSYFSLWLAGIGAEFLWPSATWSHHLRPALQAGLLSAPPESGASQVVGWWNARGLELVSATIWGISATLFTRSFLLTKSCLPRLDVALVVLIVLTPIWLILGILHFPLWVWGNARVGVIIPIVFLSAAIIRWRQGYRPARYYIVAWSMFLSLFPLLALGAVGVYFIPFPDFPLLPIQIVSAGELAFLSMALGDRVNMLTKGKEHAEALAMASQRLARYFPKKLVARILSSDEPVSLSSARRHSTIFFSDLTGFTDFSDRTEPERVSRMLNEYFTEMVALMNRYGCTLDKFMGDGIMAFFGAPDDMDEKEQAKRAVSMAVAMQKKLGELGRKWLDEELDHGIRMRCGIHQEYVTVGNFGSADLMSYTAIGGGVNLASRLETSCSPGKILVSFPVHAQTKDDFPYGPLQEMQFKGFARSYRVCELDPEAITRPAAS